MIERQLPLSAWALALVGILAVGYGYPGLGLFLGFCAVCLFLVTRTFRSREKGAADHRLDSRNENSGDGFLSTWALASWFAPPNPEEGVQVHHLVTHGHHGTDKPADDSGHASGPDHGGDGGGDDGGDYGGDGGGDYGGGGDSGSGSD